MITFSLNDELPRNVAGLAAQIEAVLLARIDQEDAEMAREIVNEKLAGQILKRRTGRLASTVHVVPAQNIGSEISGYVEAGGPDAPYGRFQEEGTDRWYDILPVNKKALAFDVAVGGAVQRIVARKVHHPPIQERSFLRSTQTEHNPQITTSLQAAIAEVLA